MTAVDVHEAPGAREQLVVQQRPALAIDRNGSIVTARRGPQSITVRVRNAPLARVLVEKIEFWSIAQPSWGLERVVERGRLELLWNVAAAHRRIGRRFFGG